MENGIQMMEEFNRIKVLMSPVLVCHPLTVILSIIKIEHRCNRIHPDAVRMEFLHPEQRVRNQEIRYLRARIVIYQCPPVRVGTLARIKMLVQAGSVKA